ncbi:hypothetical protein [Nocardia farcinica]|uniref:hypothetical protein n=1 Tax=Nocardia farcinica TaxID=37329 RepID=UPI00245567E9|nr:hypothetical protein [Nocardia farcinica]
MTVEPLPDWVIPPAGGYTVDAFLKLRDLPKHTELIDGGLVFGTWSSPSKRCPRTPRNVTGKPGR